MRKNESRTGAEDEMLAAEAALGRQDLAAARGHLAAAEKLGASKQQHLRLLAAVEAREREQQNNLGCGVWLGFLVAGGGYLLLSSKPPAGWSMPVWAAAAFLIIPAISGAAVRLRQGTWNPRGGRFRAGFRPVALAMALYTGIHLAVLRSRIASPEGNGGAFVVAVFVTLCFAALAGAVSGLTGMLASRGNAAPGSEESRP